MKVCQILEKQGCIDEQVIEEALRLQAGTDREIGEILVEMGAVKESELTEALSLQLDLRTGRSADKAAFLRQVEPFQSLTDAELREMAQTMEWRLYAPGEFILTQGGEATVFSIVKNGLAKIYVDKNGGETIIGFLGEGECCGATALLSDGVNPSNVVAVEQTLCLSQDRQSFHAVMEKHPEFIAFFNELIVRQAKKMLTRFLTAGTGTILHVEPFLYSKQVKDLMSPRQVFCEHSTTIRDAARRLSDGDCHTIVVLDPGGGLAGTVGLKRLMEASLLEDRNPGDPLGSIVEKEYRVIDSGGFFFDALHEMMKGGTDRLVVVSGEKTEGVLTSLDLLRFRGREVLSLMRTIDEAPGFAELDIARRDVESVLRTLIADGALASHACKIVSELNDKITGRVIRLVEERLGPAPSAYAWLGLGSEGRKEQTLLTDQDNAILFDEFHYGRRVESASAYFRTFAEQVVAGLNECGFPLCKGNIMATNPRYFGHLAAWERKTTDWITKEAQEGKDLIDIFTFLDFRAVHGSDVLEQRIRQHVMAKMRENPSCLRSLAQPIVSVPIPLGFFKNFIVEKNGKYKNTVNIKTYGLLPLITCAKLLAYQQGIGDTNTLERLRKLTGAEVIPENQGEAMERAFETFLTLKISGNLANLDEGRDFSNNVNPALLTIKQKQLLKEAFLAVSQIQKITRERLNVPDTA